MEYLKGSLRHYAWGSVDAIARIRGIEPTGLPEAELWFGDHPLSPAWIERQSGTVSLSEVITADPETQLGRSSELSEGRLPFLLKVLAAERPLSLQVHPGLETAVAGHQAENEAGIPVNSPQRSFPDRYHKPELIIAMEPFRVLCGFRSVEESLVVADALALPMDALIPLKLGGRSAWPSVVETFLSGNSQLVLGAFLERCARIVDGPWKSTASLVIELADLVPDDPALSLVPFLLDYQLDEGEALFLSPGVLHTYLGGTAVEVMASSDNVLRAGFTKKHVDIKSLLNVIDSEVPPEGIQRPHSAVHRYQAPVSEFAVWRLKNVVTEIDERWGPEIFLCTRGITKFDGQMGLEIGPGQAVWISATEGSYSIDVDGIAYRVALDREAG